MLVAGTQLGAMISIRRGMPRRLSAMKRMPGMPATLAISCGSVMTVVTPRGMTRSEVGGDAEAAFDVDVSVDQAGSDVCIFQIDGLFGGIAGADAGDFAVVDGDVGGFDFATEDIDEAGVFEKKIGGFI